MCQLITVKYLSASCQMHGKATWLGLGLGLGLG